MPPGGQSRRPSGSRPDSSERANGTNPRPLPATTTGGSGKRLACDNCRERKVRCNREQPLCGRCARLGHNCRYTTPGKQNPSPTDMAQLLLSLNSRLAQTEARLVMNPPLLNMNQGMDFIPTSNSIANSPMNFTNQQRFPPTDMGYLDILNSNEQNLQSDIETWSDYREAMNRQDRANG